MANSPTDAGGDVLIPGARDVRATLDGPVDTDVLVVACPPHPQHGGTRSDSRLRAVADELAARDVGCLRIDYGAWDEGYGEREDVRNAIRWADDRAETIATFGFSFGAAEAVLAAVSVEVDVAAISVLAPPATLGSDLDVVAALDDLDPETALQVVYGTRDETADWEPVVDAAAARAEIVEWPADHFFVGQETKVAADVADFLAEHGQGGRR